MKYALIIIITCFILIIFQSNTISDTRKNRSYSFGTPDFSKLIPGIRDAIINGAKYPFKARSELAVSGDQGFMNSTLESNRIDFQGLSLNQRPIMTITKDVFRIMSFVEKEMSESTNNNFESNLNALLKKEITNLEAQYYLVMDTTDGKVDCSRTDISDTNINQNLDPKFTPSTTKILFTNTVSLHSATSMHFENNKRKLLYYRLKDPSDIFVRIEILPNEKYEIIYYSLTDKNSTDKNSLTAPLFMEIDEKNSVHILNHTFPKPEEDYFEKKMMVGNSGIKLSLSKEKKTVDLSYDNIYKLSYGSEMSGLSITPPPIKLGLLTFAGKFSADIVSGDVSGSYYAYKSEKSRKSRKSRKAKRRRYFEASGRASYSKFEDYSLQLKIPFGYFSIGHTYTTNNNRDGLNGSDDSGQRENKTWAMFEKTF